MISDFVRSTLAEAKHTLLILWSNLRRISGAFHYLVDYRAYDWLTVQAAQLMRYSMCLFC